MKRVVYLVFVLLFACDNGKRTPFDVVTTCNQDSYAIEAAFNADCKCLNSFLQEAQLFNILFGLQEEWLPFNGLTMRFSTNDRLQTPTEWPTEDGRKYFGVYDPSYDTITVSTGGGSLAHELLHRYNILVRHIDDEQEAIHAGWWDKFWMQRAALHFMKTPNSESCRE